MVLSYAGDHEDLAVTPDDAKPPTGEAATEVTASLVAAAAPAAEAAEGSEDVRLFAGAQKRASSVAFEVLLPVEQLVAVSHSAAACMLV